MKVTRQQILEARIEGCAWTEESLTKAIAKRFPGKAAVDLAALVDEWLGDPSLNRQTLAQASFLAASLAPDPAWQDEDGRRQPKPQGSFLRPREALERIRASLGDATP